MGCTTIAKILPLLALIHGAMCQIAPDPKTFFPDIKGNLTKIVWAHAVNSQADLTKALNTDDIMMLEADVVVGTLNHSNGTNSTNIPIMAHPPNTESDLSFEDFLTTVLLNNTKGIKLDFKSTEAFELSKPYLAARRNQFKIPLFLNADILPGPVNATATPVDPNSFVSGAMTEFPESILSVGWTTRYGSEYNVSTGQYTKEQLQNMIDVLKKHNVTQPVTYPVRAGLAANDISAVKMLMENTSNSGNVSLTIWSTHGDHVDTDKLSELIKSIGVDKVYVDVPEDVWNKLNLNSGSASLQSAMVAAAITLLPLFFTRML